MTGFILHALKEKSQISDASRENEYVVICIFFCQIEGKK